MKRKSNRTSKVTSSLALQAASTLIDVIRNHASNQPSRKALIFLRDGETEESTRTFEEIDRYACRVAQKLRSIGGAGERALLLYPPGLDFVDGFLGSLYCGTIAVTTPLSRNRRGLPRIQKIAEDAEASLILTTQKTIDKYKGMYDEIPDLKGLRWFATDTDDTVDVTERFEDNNLSADSTALLQYTSGSTGSPKGVMISHENLLYNSKIIYENCEHSAKSVSVSWVPPFHDMGLVFGLLQPLYGGFTGVLMAPAAFLQKPARWLKAITKYRATTTGGPNFSYDLCAQKIAPERLVDFDLSSWQFAANSAEPVRWETLEKFSEKFAPCGFRKNAFYPCYGLAEATLAVSGGRKNDDTDRAIVDISSLEKGKIEPADVEAVGRSYVDCGPTVRGQKIYIVDPGQRTAVGENTVGEIWVQGPSIAKGYWKKPVETSHTFHASLKDSQDGPFLRTGDLGFIKQDRLFITGRVKDLIIIRGRNLYPQDIESAVERSHNSLRYGATAAFTVDGEGGEELVVVQELDYRQKPKYNEVIDFIQAAIFEEAEVKAAAIILIQPGSIFKTSSGKIQRKATRDAFLDERLNIVHCWRRPLHRHAVAEQTVTSTDRKSVEPAVGVVKEIAVVEWLKVNLAPRLGISAEKVDTQRPFSQYGFDSADAVDLATKLEDEFKKPVPVTLVWDHPTIEAVGRFLADGMSEQATQPTPTQATQADPIAIIGVGCRFPGANNPQEFWTLLSQGIDAITEVPPERWDLQEFYDASAISPGMMNSRWGGLLERIDVFDAEFFGISPREAQRMDPQQRLSLEVAWEALEHAGIAPKSIAGSEAGVFIGISSSDYAYLQLSNPALADAFTGTGNAHSIAANRLSYVLGLHGPSIAVDTACSSSLVTVQLACNSLRNGECELALAGGVNIILNPGLTIAFSQARMMSPDGRCKTFDESADGYVRSEGCGMVILKRLSSAVRDGNRVLALIRGAAVNQDGTSNGLIAPNGIAQQRVIKRALSDARVEPGDISYVETHGTGTVLGDPIEVGALQKVLSEGRDKNQTCWLGAVKSNIGHLEAAAGVASLIKVALSLHYKQIPQNLHFRKLNRRIALDDTRFNIPTEHKSWDTRDKTRVAGVSSFGFGGTNAHVVLQEHIVPGQPPAPIDRPQHLLCLSAKKPEATKILADRYVDLIARNPSIEIADLCYSANVGRTHFDTRIAAVASSSEQLISTLNGYRNGEESGDLWHGTPSVSDNGVVFLFGGQGSHYHGCGAKLYATQPTFRKIFDECNRILGLPEQLSELFRDVDKSQLHKNASFIQPALFAFEYSLAQMWLSWGIKLVAVMGHSLGEYAAACLAGVFSLEDGLRLVAERGRLMDASLEKGSMAVALAPIDRVEEILAQEHGRVVVAAINGHRNIVFSGDNDAMQKTIKRFELAQIAIQPLDTSHAFHSPVIEPMLEKFEDFASRVSYNDATVPFISNLTGDYYKSRCDGAYWRAHTRQPVKFAQGISRLIQNGYRNFLEIGPVDTLSNIARRGESCDDSLFLSTLRKDGDDWNSILKVIANLYVRGITIDWKGFDQDYQRKHVDLPTYPFNRQRHWLDVEKPSQRYSAVPLTCDSALHPYVGAVTTMDASYSTFSRDISPKEQPLIADHMIGEAVVFPGVAYMEAALVAGRYHFKQPVLQLTNVFISNPLVFNDDEGKTLQVTLKNSPDDPMCGNFEITSQSTASDYDDQAALHTLAQRTPGNPSGLQWQSTQSTLRQKPKGNEIEVAVRTAGLNFMDVMNVLGMLPGEYGTQQVPLGIECSGIVTATGPKVSHFKVGDAVLAIGPASCSSSMVISENFAVPLPGGMDFNEAATMPVAFLTAYYALVKLARLRRDEKVLIHSAAGGVGLAAIQIARTIGAEIYATASTDEKKSFLLSKGVKAVLGSRSLEFAEKLFQLTNGVDVVLNSLAGEAAEKSLALLSPGGRFLEIGKVDIYRNSKIGLYPFRQNLTYFAIDLERLTRESPDDVSMLLGETFDYIAEHNLTPLPYKTFGIDEAEVAFRYMAKGVHIGKVLLNINCSELLSPLIHCHGTVTRNGTLENAKSIDVSAVKSRCGNRLSAESVYNSFEQVTLNYGPQFRAIDGVHIGTSEALASVKFDTSKLVGYLLHPSILDGALQTLGTLLFTSSTVSQNLYVPYAVEQLNVYGSLDDVAYVYACISQGSNKLAQKTKVVKGEVSLIDKDGKVLVAMNGVCLKKILPHQATSLFRQESSTPQGEVNYGCVPEQGFFNIDWIEAPLIKHVSRATTTTWWLLADSRGISDALAFRLRQAGQRCIMVHSGTSFAHPNENTFIVDPDSRESYRQLERALEKHGGENTVVCLWSCDDKPEITALEAASHFSKAEWHRLYSLVRALGEKRTCKISMWLVTNYGQGIDGRRHIIPDHALPWALGKVINKEYQNIQCSGLDIEFSGLDADKWAEIIYDEMHALKQHETWIAYRNRDRLKSVCVPRSVLEDRKRMLPLKDGGVYLISGGQTGVGLEIAKYIASKVAAKLVLINRTPLDDTAPQDRREGIITLQEAGAEVLPFQGDVTNLGEMQSLVARVTKMWGKPDGVIHAAGVLKDGLITNLSYDDYEYVLRPKVVGALVLDETTANLPLDFFVLFSSMTSIYAPKGQSNHVIANAYLDAFSHYRRLRRSGISLSINWGAWGETGVVASERYRKALRDQGIHPLTTLEGIGAFDTLLRTNTTQVAYCGFLGNGRTAFIQRFGVGQQEAGFESGDILSHIVSQARSMLRSGTGANLREYDAIYKELDTSMLQRAWDTLVELGLDPLDPAQRHAAEVVRKLGLLPQYEKLIRRILHQANKNEQIETQATLIN